MPLEFVSLSEGLWALFTLEFSLLVVLVELVFVKIEAGGELHRTHPTVEISHLVDLLNMAPELGLKKKDAVIPGNFYRFCGFKNNRISETLSLAKNPFILMGEIWSFP